MAEPMINAKFAIFSYSRASARPPSFVQPNEHLPQIAQEAGLPLRERVALAGRVKLPNDHLKIAFNFQRPAIRD